MGGKWPDLKFGDLHMCIIASYYTCVRLRNNLEIVSRIVGRARDADVFCLYAHIFICIYAHNGKDHVIRFQSLSD